MSLSMFSRETPHRSALGQANAAQNVNLTTVTSMSMQTQERD